MILVKVSQLAYCKSFGKDKVALLLCPQYLNRCMNANVEQEHDVLIIDFGLSFSKWYIRTAFKCSLKRFKEKDLQWKRDLTVSLSRDCFLVVNSGVISSFREPVNNNLLKPRDLKKCYVTRAICISQCIHRLLNNWYQINIRFISVYAEIILFNFAKTLTVRYINFELILTEDWV